ncbi:MAG: tryptophanase [Clostridia bacterium]|nr:tryptophanase [Clostridia bacterium]
MANVRFFTGEHVPLEMHKVRIVQKLSLPCIERRLEAITEAGNNTFLLQNCDIFLDMLTDSGVNAMSDQQMAAMMVADDSYAGSATFTRLENKLIELFGMPHFLPAHQGRACEHILASALVKPGNVVPMNIHFTTTKAHITRKGGSVVELVIDEGLKTTSEFPFKGNFDLNKLGQVIDAQGADNVPFVRLEAGANLIGGQPFSLQNACEVAALCRAHGVLTVLDASLLQDNLYFIKQREAACKGMSIREITRALADEMDIIYFSARKLGFAKGGGICVRDDALFAKMRELVPLFEGFLTYGGMSVREMEAIVVGLDETMDEDVISQGPQFIQFMTDELVKAGVPVVTPAGGLGCHLNAMEFLPHVPQHQYPAGALAAALYIASGVRGMERGTMSEAREPDGSEVFSKMELLRLALPRRVFTLSQVKYAIDRIVWLYGRRDLVGGLTFTEEPAVLRFFFGKLKPTSGWQAELARAFRADFGDSL